MGFWWFMLFSNLLIPLMMLVFGVHFTKKAPGDINRLFGYRTAMSMKNRETWEFAHRHFGRTWLISGLIMLPLTILPHLLLLGKSVDRIGTGGAVICGVQIVLLLLSILPTEIALKRTFDKQGKRR